MLAWIVAYDIRSNRRRTKVCGCLKKHGLPMQKSVFLVQAERETVETLVTHLAALIDDRTDRVCAWPLRVHWQQDQICRPFSATPLSENFVIG